VGGGGNICGMVGWRKQGEGRGKGGGDLDFGLHVIVLTDWGRHPLDFGIWRLEGEQKIGGTEEGFHATHPPQPSSFLARLYIVTCRDYGYSCACVYYTSSLPQSAVAGRFIQVLITSAWQITNRYHASRDYQYYCYVPPNYYYILFD
jgi:hypothetical protein